jgi:4-amino-4-deoxy-L-arabinose transferase-like glycosyltransferase
MSVAGRSYALLIAILVFAAISRIAGTANAPPGFYDDEAAVGVNAYLIAEGGIDQYGNRYPVFFRALDDYKCPAYIYTTALVLKFLDLDERSTRIPAVFFGLIGIFAAFLLGREIFGNHYAGVLAALLVAASPWHFHYSRIAWQALSLTAIYPIAVFFLLRWLKVDSVKNAVLCGLFFALSLYTYTTAKLLVFVTLIGLAIYVSGRRDRWTRGTLILALTVLIFSLPYVLAYLADFQYINHRFNSLRIPIHEMPLAYLSHLHPRFLFLEGDANLRLATGIGVLSWYMAPLLIAGIYDFVRSPTREKRILLMILLFIPVLGALTGEYPHATRTIIFVPFVQLLGTGGALRALDALGGGRRRVAWFALAGCILATFGFFLNHYFGPYSRASRSSWAHGLIPALRRAHEEQVRGETVHIRHSLPYIHWMFVTRPDPETILANRSKLDVNHRVYDPSDRSNKYDFLEVKQVKREDFARPRGLWVVPERARMKLPAGAVRHRGDGWLVLRFEE